MFMSFCRLASSDLYTDQFLICIFGSILFCFCSEIPQGPDPLINS